VGRFGRGEVYGSFASELDTAGICCCDGVLYDRCGYAAVPCESARSGLNLFTAFFNVS
jgi:hypothetical protein